MSEQPKKTVKLTINGQEVEMPADASVFQAAQKLGVFVPHYCYHPDLSVAGVCRMCMVDIEKQPKLAISCNTTVAEGMVVKTDTEKVKASVQGILELHLINHPLDCPICDKAGECKLQDYYTVHGLYESRMDYDKKNHKPKVQDIGTIVLDSERCILCTRCVRFTAEVTKSFELGIFNRGDRSTLTTFDGGPLNNDYTGNLADICPVGALTAKDFRFQQRVWFLEKRDSICGMCSTGCNTTVSVNPSTNKLYRIEPRRNPDVNASWMCDTGRWNYHHVYAETRVRTPKERKDGVVRDQTWHECFSTLNSEIESAPDKVCVGLSTHLTNEEISTLVDTFKELGVTQFIRVADDAAILEKNYSDKILKHSDLTPNAFGFEEVFKKSGTKFMTLSEGKEALKKQSFKWLFVLGLEGNAMSGVAELLLATPKETKTVVHATNEVGFFEKCDWILPNVSAFEKSGSFVNFSGRLQKLVAAIPWQHTSRDGLALALGMKNGNDRETLEKNHYQTVFNKRLSETVFPGVRTDWRKLGATGVNIGEVGYREGRK